MYKYLRIRGGGGEAMIAIRINDIKVQRNNDSIPRKTYLKVSIMLIEKAVSLNTLHSSLEILGAHLVF